jgi:hypothetical protein
MLDVAQDGEILKACLPSVISDADKPEEAVKAGEFYLANFASDRGADGIRGGSLPMAMLALGNFDGAKAMLKDASDKAEGPLKARTMLNYGDVFAVGSFNCLLLVEASGKCATKARNSCGSVLR